MASGYENSDHYAGPPPGPRTFVLTAVAVGVLIAILLGLW